MSLSLVILSFLLGACAQQATPANFIGFTKSGNSCKFSRRSADIPSKLTFVGQMYPLHARTHSKPLQAQAHGGDVHQADQIQLLE